MKQSRFSNGQERNARAVIATSYSTFAERNGPKVIKAWRKKFKKLSEMQAANLEKEKVLDENWPGCLKDCFHATI